MSRPDPGSDPPPLEAMRALAGRMKHVTPAEVLGWLDAKRPFTVVDVRTRDEYMAYHIPGARLVPLDELRHRVEDVADLPKPLVVHCEHGRRSLDATFLLMLAGVEDVYNMTEGISGWAGPIEHGLGRR